jgi:hypothetical protein
MMGEEGGEVVCITMWTRNMEDKVVSEEGGVPVWRMMCKGIWGMRQ